MRYFSVCSGIEAASVAWKGLGWECVGLSEVEPFPCKVLNHHYPSVYNYGDMTKLLSDERFLRTDFDVLVGGTPCQSFSIAGLRRGLDDERGNLALEYCRILRDKQPRWFVWENVPGVLSSGGGKDFKSILEAFVECGYSVCWRILDAKYFGVAQRRRRVFVVGHLGKDWRPPYAVLFERESLRGDIKKGGKKRQGSARGVEAGAGGGSWWDGEQVSGTLTKNNANGAQRMPDKENFGAGLKNRSEVSAQARPAQLASTLNASFGDKQGLEDQHALNGAPLFVPMVYENHPADSRITEHNDVSPTLSARMGTGGGNVHLTLHEKALPATAFKIRGGKEGGGKGYLGSEDSAFTISTHQDQTIASSPPVMIRRLTPVECLRLQGFPDDYLDIPGCSADGPKYKAIGNSMAVPVMRWIGERIDKVSRIIDQL